MSQRLPINSRPAGWRSGDGPESRARRRQQESNVTDEKRNVIGGDVNAKADVTEGKVNKPGALVEDSSLGGLTSGGVAPKDPGGKVTEGEATDKRENP